MVCVIVHMSTCQLFGVVWCVCDCAHVRVSTVWCGMVCVCVIVHMSTCQLFGVVWCVCVIVHMSACQLFGVVWCVCVCDCAHVHVSTVGCGMVCV